MEAQPQLSALRGVILELLCRRDPRPGGGGPLCVEQTSSQAGLNEGGITKEDFMAAATLESATKELKQQIGLTTDGSQFLTFNLGE
jgi:hypothetical protein